MADKNIWHPRLICKSCGWHTECPEAEVHRIRTPTCPSCGVWLINVKEVGLNKLNERNARIESMMYTKKNIWKKLDWYIRFSADDEPKLYDPCLLKLKDEW